MASIGDNDRYWPYWLTALWQNKGLSTGICSFFVSGWIVYLSRDFVCDCDYSLGTHTETYEARIAIILVCLRDRHVSNTHAMQRFASTQLVTAEQPYKKGLDPASSANALDCWSPE
jgi:hypothetical protein